MPATVSRAGRELRSQAMTSCTRCYMQSVRTHLIVVSTYRTLDPIGMIVNIGTLLHAAKGRRPASAECSHEGCSSPQWNNDCLLTPYSTLTARLFSLTQLQRERKASRDKFYVVPPASRWPALVSAAGEQAPVAGIASLLIQAGFRARTLSKWAQCAERLHRGVSDAPRPTDFLSPRPPLNSC